VIRELRARSCWQIDEARRPHHQRPHQPRHLRHEVPRRPRSSAWRRGP